MDEIKTSDKYDQSIIYAIDLGTLDILFRHFSLLQQKKIKIIFYYDNLYLFAQLQPKFQPVKFCLASLNLKKWPSRMPDLIIVALFYPDQLSSKKLIVIRKN